jgi:hypothetical protein
VPAVVPQAAPAALAVAQPAYAIAHGLKNAMPVSYNTFAQIICASGNFVERESKLILGDSVTFELLSFQDSFTITPNVNGSDKKLVRFSDDGVTCSDGTGVQEHLTWLKNNGFPRAMIKNRTVVVGVVKSSAKTDKLNGELVQFDLSPKSRDKWTRYLHRTVYLLQSGQKTLDQLKQVKASTQLAQNGNETYTVAVFEVA